MAEHATIRDYNLTYYDAAASGSGIPYILLDAVADLSHYAAVPTVAESRAAFDLTDPVDVRYTSLFYNERANTYPKLPEGGTNYNTMFRLSNITIAPALPRTPTSYSSWFQQADLSNPPVIPIGTRSIDYMFYECPISWPVSIPHTVTDISNLYRLCEEMTGEMVVRVTSLSSTYRANVFTRTVKPITLYGNKSFCETIAATATSNNVSWSPWYDPVPAVTNRGQGSYTTAEDITRMVRNGALAVNTYAPGRMVYNQGDIVRADEWEALVEAAQTIDPTVTLSTHYSNLNKIEAAFDSAL